MTGMEFAEQMQRLQRHFGKKALSQEFADLVFAEVRDMSAARLRTAVDVWIGNNHQSRPPRLNDFREAVIAERNSEFKRDLRGATQVAIKGPDVMRAHLNRILSKEIGGEVNGLKHALAMARLRRPNDAS